MKRTISLTLGLLAFALLPALAQAPTKPTGKIHGHVTGPEGSPRTAGAVSLSTDGGHTLKFTFPISSTGDYTGDAAPGTYTVVFRAPDTPLDKMVDSFDGVKIVAGQDVLQDFDMSRKEYIDKMTPQQKKDLEELKKQNADVLKNNATVKNLNADIKAAAKDFNDADNAKEAEIKTAKYTEVETLMLKDTVAKPDASIFWADLGLAQVGLAKAQSDPKKYDDAVTNLKKALAMEAASSKPNPGVQGIANSGLGEIYARSGKVPEANAAYDAAAKVNPTQAGSYLKNEAVIFYQVGNADAQAADADEAIKADPTLAVAYYLKGQGLIAKATIDATTQRYILPPGCAEAYQMYLKLAPTGAYAADVKGILDQSTQKVGSGYKAGKK